MVDGRTGRERDWEPLMSAAEHEVRGGDAPESTAQLSPQDRDAFFERLCLSLSYALIATDEKLNIRFWNTVATQMFAYRSELAAGRPVIELFPESARAAIANIVN